MKTFTIILVDDDDTNLVYYKSVIQRECEDTEVITAKNGFEALELVDKNNCDLLMTDIFMPKMGGVKLCQNMYLKHPTIHTILVSNRTSVSHYDVISMGADSFISKLSMEDHIGDIVYKIRYE